MSISTDREEMLHDAAEMLDGGGCLSSMYRSNYHRETFSGMKGDSTFRVEG